MTSPADSEVTIWALDERQRIAVDCYAKLGVFCIEMDDGLYTLLISTKTDHRLRLVGACLFFVSLATQTACERLFDAVQ